MKMYPVVDHLPYSVRRDVRAIRTGEFRCPKKGEWYVSGAVPEAYMAPNDLSMEFHIAKLVKVKTTIVENTVIVGVLSLLLMLAPGCASTAQNRIKVTVASHHGEPSFSIEFTPARVDSHIRKAHGINEEP